jgi:hypothetical protein
MISALSLVVLLSAPELPGALSGTWGLPPEDGRVGLTGSFLAIAPNPDGSRHVDLDLNPAGWSCTLHADPSWNPETQRLEWLNRSTETPAQPCWLSGAPGADALDLAIWCPYNCTGDDRHALRLERIATDVLSPPDNVVDTFCATHDRLRQEFCRPGALGDAIAEGNRAGRKLGVLGDGDENDHVPFLPETDKELLQALRTCAPPAGDRACLARALAARTEAAREAVETRQRFLASLRSADEKAAVSLPETAALAWAGDRSLVSDQQVAALSIKHCAPSGCEVDITGETNYTFGYQERRGDCTIFTAPLRFTDAARAVAWVEPRGEDADAHGAGPFANFCRVELRREGDDDVAVGLLGTGCGAICMNAQYPALRGVYHPHPRPSFACAENFWGMPWDEENVCLDPELAALDRDLAAAFAHAKAAAAPPAQKALVGAQRAWLKNRRDECDGGAVGRRTCLVAAYRRRLEELRRP